MTNLPPRAHLTEGPIIKSLFALAAPIILANILQAGYQLTDAFWVGRLGQVAVAAVALTGPIAFLSIALGVGFAIAGSTLIAQYYGAKNYRQVSHVAAQTLLMIIAVSLLLSAVGYALAPLILRLMGAAPEVYAGALGFMRLTFVGLVFNFFFFMFQSIMRGIGEAKLPVYIVLGTVLLNFILDPLFIFGWGPVPALGVVGAALATIGTQSIAALLGLIILLGGHYGVHLTWRDFKPDLAYIKRAFMLGLPASVEQSTRALGLTIFTFLVASFGTLTVAAYGAGSNILQIVMIPGIGLAMSISTLVGQNIGAGNLKRAAAIGRLGAWSGFTILTGVGVIVFLLARPLVAFFVPSDQAVIDMGATFLRIVALSWGFMGIQFALVGALRASGQMWKAMLLALISQWVIQFPLAYLLSKHAGLGTNGLWWSFVAANVLTAGVAMLWYSRLDWEKSRLIEPEEQLTEQVSEEIIMEEGVR